MATRGISPRIDSEGQVGKSAKRWLKGWFKSLRVDGDVTGITSLELGGVAKTAWPSPVAGSNGAVFYSGSVTLAGQTGVTVTHNRGATDYLVKVCPTGQGALEKIGDITVVKNANTAVIYNSGWANLTADVELSVIA